MQVSFPSNDNRPGRGRTEAHRPPWSTEATILSHCTSCGDCIRACPEHILGRGRAGTPVIDFDAGACTFCGDCARVCREDVFDLSIRPWSLTAHLSADCFLNAGVSCRSCTDACDARALHFDLRAGPVGSVRVDADACTGCGACVSVCPTGAIAIADATPRLEAAE